MADLSSKPSVPFQQAQLGNGVLNTVFPPTAQGREVGDQLYLWDKDRLLVLVNESGTVQWKELFLTNPAGTAFAANQPTGTDTITNGTNTKVVNNTRCTASSVVLITAITPGLRAAAPVQFTVVPGNGSFTVNVNDFAGALVNVTADVNFIYAIIG